MADENRIMEREAETVRGLQRTIRKQLDQRGHSLKAASFDSGIGYSTLCSYFTNEKDAKPSALTVAGLRLLLDALPADLLSLLLPDGWQIVRAPEGIDHDALSEQLVDYLATKQAAHHPDSECGPALGPNETALLDSKVVQITARAA
jgi:hypothetical protein